MTPDPRWTTAMIALMDADPAGMRHAVCERITRREALIRYYESLLVQERSTYALAALARLTNHYVRLADDKAALAALEAERLVL